MVISETKHEATKIKDFPKLMISKDGVEGVIVLFERSGYGTKVGGKGIVVVGVICDNWDMTKFSDYHGEVTLRNS